MSSTSTEARLRELGIELPPPPKAVGAYVTVIRTGNLVVTSGQLPWVDDRLRFAGKLGTEGGLVDRNEVWNVQIGRIEQGLLLQIWSQKKVNGHTAVPLA